MFIKRFLLVAFILLSFNNIGAQELIQNGGFEKYHDSWLSITLTKNAKYWKIPNKSTPDLLTPKNNFKLLNYGKKGVSKVSPFKGNSSAGIIIFSLSKNMWNYREFITNKLKSPLIKDSLYYISFYICLNEEAMIITNNIQAYFSAKYEEIDTNSVLNQHYIINISNGDFFYKTEWVNICGIYRAKGNEKFITIGNFQDLNSIIYYKSDSRPKYYYDTGNSSYILIDNVSLIPIQDSSQCDCCIKRYSIETIQNDSISKEERNKLVSKEGSILSLKNLQFNTNSYEIKPESFKELDQLYNLLSLNPELRISVNGYTDNKGSERYNQKLSMKRAKAVVEYLIEKGISEDRLSYKGYGIDNPIASNETEEGRAANRRVEVEFLKEKIENEKTNH